MRRFNAHIKSYKDQQKIIDGYMWTMGVYVTSAVETAVEHNLAGHKAKSQYIEKPFMSRNEEIETQGQYSESREDVAVFEMKQRTKYLKQQGLPLSPL